jgi:hypothetical protein
MDELLPDIPDEPLEYQWRPRAMVQIPAELVVAIAQGLEDPDDIAERFGFTGQKWAQLREYAPFKAAVAGKVAELEKSGWVFRQKAAMGAEMVMEQVIVSAMSHDVSLVQKLETLKTLAKLGNLEPKEDKQVQAGAGFQIQINLGDHSVSLGHSQPQIVDITPSKLDIATLDIPFEDAE